MSEAMDLPPDRTPEPPKRRRVLLLALLAALVVAAVAVTLVVVLRPGASPSEVVERYYDASRTGDCDELESVVTDDFVFLDGTRECNEESLGTNDADYTLGEENIDGEDATVEVMLTGTLRDRSSFEVDLTAQLVRDGRSWKIDSFE